MSAKGGPVASRRAVAVAGILVFALGWHGAARNGAPTAAFEREASPASLLAVTFDGSSSTDPEGSIVRYLWSFGDGTSGSGERVTHTYADAGSYIVELVVYDDRGVSDSLAALVDLSEPSGIYPLGIDVGSAAVPFSLADLAGEPVALDDYRGFVVVLEFWASYCIPCNEVMDHLARLATEHAGVKVLGVSLDRSEGNLLAFLADKEGPTVILWGSWEEATEIRHLYDVGEIPHLLVIDRKGIIRFRGHYRDFDEEAVTEWL
ncbi:MAG: redoxin domain-containing protein [Candidatus Bipolaricaulota bacterium]|nr:MAG: redoxin domain-containing protein [Candidatus Bipolaricaulota bacterium]